MKTLFQYFSLKNFYRNPLSTFVGLTVLFATFHLIFEGKATLGESTPFLIYALGSLFYGNPKDPKNPQNTALILLPLFILLFGCKSFKKLPKTQIDTIRIVYEKTIPKDSISVRFINDTLKHTIIEKKGRATLIIEKQKEIIRASAICDTIRIKDTLKILTEKVVYQYPKEKQGFFADNWAWVYGAILLAIIALAIIFRNFKNSQ